MTLVKPYQFLKPTRKLRGRPPLFYSDKYKEQRTLNVVNIVRDNQPVLHGKLLRIITKRHRLGAETTIEPFIKQLVGDKVLARVMIGKQKVAYYVPEVEEIDRTACDSSIRARIAILQDEINRLEHEYSKASFEQKWVHATQLLKMAFDGIKECALMTALDDVDAAETQYHREEQAFRVTIRKVIEIVRSDKEAQLVFPLIRPVLTLNHTTRDIATRNLPYYPPGATK